MNILYPFQNLRASEIVALLFLFDEKLNAGTLKDKDGKIYSRDSLPERFAVKIGSKIIQCTI